jgi:hypothetical protein
MLVGPEVITGGVSSATVMEAEQVSVIPLVSVTLNITVVVPRLSVVPATGSCVGTPPADDSTSTVKSGRAAVQSTFAEKTRFVGQCVIIADAVQITAKKAQNPTLHKRVLYPFISISTCMYSAQ